jgi:CRP/FNR family transcriptional regulator
MKPPGTYDFCQETDELFTGAEPMDQKTLDHPESKSKSHPPWFDIFKRVAMFETLDEEVVRRIFHQSVVQTYSKGEILFKEGESSVNVFIVLVGRVKLVKHLHGRDETILNIIHPGQAVDELAVVEKSSSPTSGVALEESKVAKIHQCVFLKCIHEYPELAFQIIRSLGERLRQFTDNIASMANLTVEKRLARLLIRFSNEMGIPDSRGILLNLPVTRTEMAEIIGTSTEVLIREIQKMRKKGWLEVYGKRIVLRDPKSLQSI